MRRPGLALFGLLAGCSFAPVPLDQAGDGGPDTPITPGCTTFSSQLDTCTLPAGAALTLSGTLAFDTDTGELTQAGTVVTGIPTMVLATNAAEVQAILATTVTFDPGTMLRATGSRPFAIIATGDVVVGDGAIVDVGRGGAGARASCDATGGMNLDGGAAGGGGGGFGGAGGAGGTGNNDGTPSTPGMGGAAVALPAGPLGGCPGGKGGDDNNDPGGAGGVGGGAIYIVSATKIELVANAGIDAGGAGGIGGEQHGITFGDAGGGGGGSGGMIFLEAPRVTSAGTLAANGGGGGEGSGNQAQGRNGNPGGLDTARASGGNGGSSTGTDGGAGGALGTLIGDAVLDTDNGGGGGGGGGAGFIRVRATTPELNAQISPAPMP
ncbi:MAG TPA: hypothetical protein VFQ53_20550 [Kofleriaceae bacterium]|nr:hypothetical protein [Kofleriaceae bacterium]